VDFDQVNAISDANGDWPVVKPKLPPNTAVTRHVAIFNDELAGSEIILRWEFRRGDRRGNILRQDEIKLSIPPGEFRTTDIRWLTPADGDVALILKVRKDGQERFVEDKIVFQITDVSPMRKSELRGRGSRADGEQDTGLCRAATGGTERRGALELF
jgi:hypothetical protein